MIEIKLHGHLKMVPEEKKDIELSSDSNMTVREFITKLKLPAGQIGLIVVDGKSSGEEDLVTPDSVVEIFPSFGGG